MWSSNSRENEQWVQCLPDNSKYQCIGMQITSLSSWRLIPSFWARKHCTILIWLLPTAKCKGVIWWRIKKYQSKPKFKWLASWYANQIMHSWCTIFLSHCIAPLIAERISARLWMRDLFSLCTCVRAYMSVTLRNINLQYCLGMSIWGHP